MQLRPFGRHLQEQYTPLYRTRPGGAKAMWQTPPGAVQTRPDAAKVLWQTPPGAVHSSVVQTRPDTAQALWQTPPGAVHYSVVKAVNREDKRSRR